MALRDNIKIMVVDDMSTSRGLIIQPLEKIGVKNLDFRKDGKSALDSLMRAPAHLVISDYNMPGMDGLQLLKELRHNKMTAKIGFILVTGSADKDLVNKAKQFGINNFLKKPFTPQSLQACIEAVVGKL
ncbi:MAG: response regulator [Pseudomonadota bacterium]